MSSLVERRRRLAEGEITTETTQAETAAQKFDTEVAAARTQAIAAIEADERYQKIWSLFDGSIDQICSEFIEEHRPQPEQVIEGYTQKQVITGYTGLFRKKPVYTMVQGDPIYKTVKNTEVIRRNTHFGIAPDMFISWYDSATFKKRYLNEELQFTETGLRRVIDNYFIFLRDIEILNQKIKAAEAKESKALSEYHKLIAPSEFDLINGITQGSNETYFTQQKWAAYEKAGEEKHNATIDKKRFMGELELAIDPQSTAYPSVTFSAFGYSLVVAAHPTHETTVFSCTFNGKTTDGFTSLDAVLDHIALL